MTEAATATGDEQVGEEASGAFSMKPLMFETFVCSMAMMSFVALAGPIARVLGLRAMAGRRGDDRVGHRLDDHGAVLGRP